MKTWDEMTPQEQDAEMGKTIFADATELDLSSAITIQQEAVIILSDHLDLLGFYITLLLLWQQKILNGYTQEALAKFMNISRPTYIAYRNKLVALKIIRVTQSTTNPKGQDIFFNYLEPISPEDYRKRFRTHGRAFILKWLYDMRKKLFAWTPEELAKEATTKEAREAQLKIDGMIIEKAKEIRQEEKAKEQAKKKAEEQRFPAIDYKSVLDGYRKYKGVYLKVGSPDEARVRHAIKQMFLSGHKVFDILQCMKFFKEHCKEEKFAWMQSWTMETIGKKMPEFKAGTWNDADEGKSLPRYRHVIRKPNPIIPD